jgi:hypothetical protein
LSENKYLRRLDRKTRKDRIRNTTWKGKYQSMDDTKNRKRKRKLLSKRHTKDERHTQTHRSLTETF